MASGFALLRTQGTADASGVAFLLYVSALIVGITLNQCSRPYRAPDRSDGGDIRPHRRRRPRIFLIDHSHAVHDVDSVELAGLYTASGTQTAIGARLISGSRHGCGDLTQSSIP